MSGSSTSGGGATPPYPSPNFHGIDHPTHSRQTPSPTSESNNGGSQHGRTARRGDEPARAANYYASGNSMSNASSPLGQPAAHGGGGGDYMYAMDTREDARNLSMSASLDSEAYVDSQKRSYHPIEFMMDGGGSEGNFMESLESGRLVRHTSESVPTSGFGMLTSAGQNSFVATAEQTFSPMLSRPITYGLSPPESPPPPPQQQSAAVSARPATTGDASRPQAPSVLPAPPLPPPQQPADSLPSIHGSVFSDVPKQLLPEMHSRRSTASTVTTADKSPLEPSMTARGATAHRSAGPSVDLSRLMALPSPNSSVDTHRPATPTPLSEPPRAATDGGGRGLGFPAQRLPNPPERPPSHLLVDSGAGEDRRSSRSTPAGLQVSSPISPNKTAAYQTPLALLAESSDSSNSGSSRHDGQLAHVAKKLHGVSLPTSSSSSASSRRTAPKPGAAPLPAAPPVEQLSSGRPTTTDPPPPPSLPAAALAPSSSPPPQPAPPPLTAAQLEQQHCEADGTVPPPNSSAEPRSSSSALPSSAEVPRTPPFSVSPPPPGPPDFVHFTPLIQQHDYDKSDIKRIACTGAFTMGDLSTMAVKLRQLRHGMVGRAEPIAAVQRAALRAGRVKALKDPNEGVNSGGPQVEHESGAAAADSVSSLPAPPRRSVDVGDFRDTLVTFDNVILAVSFALWGSVAHYNDLVRGLLDYCAGDVTRRRDESESDKDEADADGEGPKGLAAPPTRLKIPLSSLMRFLNHCGVDVLIMSANRRAASSFCAKRQQVRRRTWRDCNGDAASAHEHASEKAKETDGEQSVAEEREEAVVPAPPLRRMLIALSYDGKERLWCPLTTSRPIRATAAAWHRYRRLCRGSARRTERRQRRHEEAEARQRAAKAEAQAKLAAWQQRMAAFCAAESAVGAAAAPEPAVAVTVPTGSATVGEAAATATSEDSDSPLRKDGNRLPFDGVWYPNLVQTDAGFVMLLKQGLHPLFGLSRLRVLVGVPLGLAVVFFGVAFLIYLTRTTTVCFFDSVAGACVSVADGDNSTSSSASCLTLLAGDPLDGFESSLPHRYLYGRPVALGNCLVVTVCCAFAAVVDCTLISYFAVRYLALGGVRPRFHYVLQCAQVLLGAVSCAFAAYALFLCRLRRHTMPCSTLMPTDAALCSTRLSSCGSRYRYVAHTRLDGTHVALALSIVYLVLCVLSWCMALLPTVPPQAQQDAIPTATPDTYTFRPSFFAPDGPSPHEVAQLQAVMQGPLRQDLEQCVQQRDRLLTASTTIGEMMQANRLQSLRQMALNEQRRLRRTRPFAKEGKKGGGGGGRTRRRGRGSQRYMVYSDDASDTRKGGSRSSSSSSSDSDTAQSNAAAAARDRKVVLAPRLRQRVDELGEKVRARAAHPEAASNPLSAARVAPASSEGGRRAVSFGAAGSRTSASTAAAAGDGELHSFSGRPSATHAAPPPPRRVVVVADDEMSVRSSTSGKDVLFRVDSPPSLSAGAAVPMTAATFAATSPLKPAAVGLDRRVAHHSAPPAQSLLPPQPAVSMLTSRPSFYSPRAVEERRKISAQSTQLSYPSRSTQVGRPSLVSVNVEAEIDHIVTRLRGAGQA